MISFNTNTKSFEDINKVLQDIKNQFNSILERLNPESFTEDSEAQGELGDLRIIRTEEDLNSFEIKTKDGWQRPYIGENIVVFKRKKDKSSMPSKKSITELEASDSSTGSKKAKQTIYDEKAGKFVIARPDHISQWIWFDASSHNVTEEAPWEYTHDLGVLPSLAQIQFAPGAYDNPTTGTDETALEDQSGVIWYTHLNNSFADSDSTSQRAGGMYHITATKVLVECSRTAMARGFVPSTGAGYDHTDGAIRILLWK